MRKEGNAVLTVAKAEYKAIGGKPAVEMQGAGDSHQ